MLGSLTELIQPCECSICSLIVWPIKFTKFVTNYLKSLKLFTPMCIGFHHVYTYARFSPFFRISLKSEGDIDLVADSISIAFPL
jgi:hypothetical protein